METNSYPPKDAARRAARGELLAYLNLKGAQEELVELVLEALRADLSEQG